MQVVSEKKRKEMLSSAATDDCGGKTLATTYFYLEAFNRRSYIRWLIGWALFLFLCSALIVYSPMMQLDCVSFCDTAHQTTCDSLITSESNSSSLRWQRRSSTCFDPTSDFWLSTQSSNYSTTTHQPGIASRNIVQTTFWNSLGHGNPRRYGRFVLRYLATDFSTNRKAVEAVIVACYQMVDERGLPLQGGARVLATIRPYLATYSLVSMFGDEAAIIVDLPLGAQCPPLTQEVGLLFENGPPLQQNTTSGNFNGAVQLTYVASSSDYLVIDGVARYVLALFALAAACFVWLSHSTSKTLSVVESASARHSTLRVFWRCLRSLRTERFHKNARAFGELPPLPRLCIWFTIGSAVLCDPLTIVFVYHPSVTLFQTWCLDLMPWLRFALLMALAACLGAAITSGAVGLMVPGGIWRSLPWKRAAGAALFPTLLYLASVAWALRTNRPSYPTALATGRYGVSSIPAVVAISFPAPWLLLILWRSRNRMLFHRRCGVDDSRPSLFGVPSRDATGVRMAVLWVRLCSPLLIVVWIMILGVYFGYLSQAGVLLPVYAAGQLVESLLCVATSCVLGILTVPLRFSITQVPPRPSDAALDAATTLSSAITATSPTPNSSATDVSLVSIKQATNAMVAHPSTPLLSTVMAAPSQAFADNKKHSSTDAVANASCLWWSITWTEAHFDALRQGLVPNCGYAFDTEAQREDFEQRHASIPQAEARRYVRSFFCWETAVRSLNMSNEAYNEIGGGDDIDHLLEIAEYQQTCCESALSRCCCCSTGSEVADPDPVTDAAASGQMLQESTDGGETRHSSVASRRRFTETSTVAIDDDPVVESDFVLVTVPSDGTPASSPACKTTAQKLQDAGLFQIQVGRFGFKLVKVLDIFGVRVLIAATPPPTAVAASAVLPQVCIAFRGTVNLRNALTDADASMVQHDEMPSGCKVHRGFYAAFNAIVPKLRDVLAPFFEDAAWGAKIPSILCTGHSLGGALAMLCAYSLTAGQLRGCLHDAGAKTTLRCYTFGAPRVGNDSFARCYDRVCPETYRIVNENDIVATFGLCWHVHGGRQVTVNRDGDAVIEGTWLETVYQPVAGAGSSLQNHLLVRYGGALDNCLCSRNLNMLCSSCCSFLMTSTS